MFRSVVTSIVLAAMYFGYTVAFSGDATWYHTGLGACGAFSVDSDRVVALNPVQYANGVHCFQHILVHANGKTVDATVVDLCPGCGSGSIDLSPVAFTQLASLDTGRINVLGIDLAIDETLELFHFIVEDPNLSMIGAALSLKPTSISVDTSVSSNLI